MNALVHVTVAVFTGLLAPAPSLGVWIVVTQLLPLTDALLKYIFGYEPLHTIWGYVVLGFIYEANLPFIYPYLMASYLLHLVLDVLVPEGIELFAPWSEKQIAYPVKNSEKIVFITSLVGILIIAAIKFL